VKKGKLGSVFYEHMFAYSMYPSYKDLLLQIIWHPEPKL